MWFSGVKNRSYLVNYTHVMHVEFIALETLAYDIKRVSVHFHEPRHHLLAVGLFVSEEAS